MSDDLDAELLALAGDSEEEHSPPPEDRNESPAHASSSPQRDHSPADMGRKGTAKPARRSRKAVRDDEEDGEV